MEVFLENRLILILINDRMEVFSDKLDLFAHTLLILVELTC